MGTTPALQNDDRILDALGVVTLKKRTPEADTHTVTVDQLNAALKRAYDIGWSAGYSEGSESAMYSCEPWL